MKKSSKMKSGNASAIKVNTGKPSKMSTKQPASAKIPKGKMKMGGSKKGC